MTVFFSSDHHFSHANIIDFAGRPFVNVDHMNYSMVEKWNSVVNEDDTVYVLGDFAMGHREKTLVLADQLNGYKKLVPGNHDNCWKGLSVKMVEKWTPYYEGVGFEIMPGQMDHTLPDGTVVTLCHFPYSFTTRYDDKYSGNRPIDEGKWLLHGHTHEKEIRTGERQIHIGVDAWDFTPVSEEWIMEIIDESN